MDYMEEQAILQVEAEVKLIFDNGILPEIDQQNSPTNAIDKSKVQPKTRQSVSLVDKERLIDAFEKGEDYFLLGRLLGIRVNTTRNIIFRYQKTNKISTGKKGGSKAKISSEIGEELFRALDEHPTMTLNEMVQYLEKRSIHCSMSTVSRFVSGKLTSAKIIRESEAEVCSDSVKELRRNYVKRYFSEEWSMKECIYINQCSFNLWMRNRISRTKTGDASHNELPNYKRPSISLLVSFCKAGPIYFELLKGSFAKESYSEFLQRVCSNLDPDSTRYLIHDNGSLHGGVVLPNPCHKIVHLPPYSSFLNPTETLFSKLKSHIRHEINDVQKEMSLDKIVTAMKQAIEKELMKDDYCNLKPFYKKIRTFFPSSILMEDIVCD